MRKLPALIYLTVAVLWGCVAGACFLLVERSAAPSNLLGYFAAALVVYNLARAAMLWNTPPRPARPFRPTPARSVTREDDPQNSAQKREHFPPFLDDTSPKKDDLSPPLSD